MGSNIDGFNRPARKLRQGDEELLRGMRWLYDDDADYERAKRKMASELSREKLKKQIARKVRIKKAKLLAAKLAGNFKRLAIAAYTRLRAKYRKRTLITVSVMAVALVGVLVYISKDSDPQVLGENLPNSPTYDTLLPDNKVENTSSGNYAYDKKRKLVSYTDDIGSTPITVSQQPLPEKFKSNPYEELAKLAKGIQAGEKLETGTTTAYIGTSESGTQAVFVKNQVLVFIRAGQDLDTIALFEYIDSLN